MNITIEQFADMIKSGRAIGRKITTQTEGELHPVIYEFQKEVSGELFYLLTNRNLVKDDGSYTYERGDFSYNKAAFIDSVLSRKEKLQYIKLGKIEPKWRM